MRTKRDAGFMLRFEQGTVNIERTTPGWPGTLAQPAGGFRQDHSLFPRAAQPAQQPAEPN